MSNWIRELQRVRLRAADEVPKGWKTMDELQEDFGLQYARTYKIVDALVKAGSARKQKFRVQCGSLVRNKFHYRLCKTKS